MVQMAVAAAAAAARHSDVCEQMGVVCRGFSRPCGVTFLACLAVSFWWRGREGGVFGGARFPNAAVFSFLHR